MWSGWVAQSEGSLLMRKYSGIALLLVFALAVMLVLPLAGCGSSTTGGASNSSNLSQEEPYKPVFTDPAEKLKETSSPEFSEDLYEEAVAYEPLLKTPGTQVTMGYWSSKGNHGSLVRVLDTINDGPATTPPRKAVWDEGATSSYQYPEYDTILEEHWYERYVVKDGKVKIFGVTYTDPHPVTADQADAIWGRYSQRYADMAKLIRKATGVPVRAVCFVQGAKANRVFYKYELPELKTLEQSGDAQVFFAKTQDADPDNPADWITGTANAPTPVPAAP